MHLKTFEKYWQESIKEHFYYNSWSMSFQFNSPCKNGVLKRKRRKLRLHCEDESTDDRRLLRYFSLNLFPTQFEREF